MLAGPRARGVTIRRLGVLLLVGAAGFLLDGHALASWADSLPDSAATLKDAAHWWDNTTAALGLAAPYDALHRWIRRAMAAPFG